MSMCGHWTNLCVIKTALEYERVRMARAKGQGPAQGRAPSSPSPSLSLSHTHTYTHFLALCPSLPFRGIVFGKLLFSLFFGYSFFLHSEIYIFFYLVCVVYYLFVVHFLFRNENHLFIVHGMSSNTCSHPIPALTPIECGRNIGWSFSTIERTWSSTSILLWHS